MTEPYYNHTGEVREALNFRCLHCNDIFTAPQGLGGHLSRMHNIDPQNLQHKKDWDVTADIAGDYMPIENRKPSLYSGDRKMKSKIELTHNLECLVPGCRAIYVSSAGMSVHQKKAHGNQGSVQDVNWRWTKEPTTINDKRSRAAQQRKGIGGAAPPASAEQPRPKRKYTKRVKSDVMMPTPLMLTPDSKFIEIAAVIRVPITIGQAEIIAQES